jgi:hypothetical protein
MMYAVLPVVEFEPPPCRTIAPLVETVCVALAPLWLILAKLFVPLPPSRAIPLAPTLMFWPPELEISALRLLPDAAPWTLIPPATIVCRPEALNEVAAAFEEDKFRLPLVFTVIAPAEETMESVTVSADVSLLKTETGDVSHNVTTQLQDELPMGQIGATLSLTGGTAWVILS